MRGAIPGFMGAMTMPYKLAAPETISELHVGDVITARLLVEDGPGAGDARLDQVVVVGQARPDTVPAVQYHVPAAGDAVPDFHLLNQSGRVIHLGQFKGEGAAADVHLYALSAGGFLPADEWELCGDR